MEQLTSEQRDMINDSLWVVNAVLKKLGLQNNEDYRQSGMLYLCKCLLRFDANKKIKWTTYAYKNVYFYLKRIYNDEKDYQRCFIEDDYESVQEMIGDGTDINELVHDRALVEKVRKLCSPEENKILEMKALGKSNFEVANALKVSITIINIRIKKIREKTQFLRGDFLGGEYDEKDFAKRKYLEEQKN